MRKLGLLCVAVAIIVLFASATMVSAQDSDAVHAMFVSAPKEATNIKGVSILADRPKGFNPLTASGVELGRYGLPQRPDKQANPGAFANWEKGMRALRYRPSAHIEAKPYSSTNLRMAKQGPSAVAISATPTSLLSYNWSGVANTNKLTSWNNKTSFTYVQSIWNVPAAQPPVGACGNGITGPFFEASWNGIDGYSNGDVIQGGSLSIADCGGPADNEYIAWVEWYPSYSILELFCGSDPCPVNAGDDFYVVTYGANSGTQFVFVEDLTQGWGGTLSISYISGPLLVGSSEEQIVERPCCNEDDFPLALTNYVYNFFDLANGSNGRGTPYFAGEQTTATVVIDMVDDGVTQIISNVSQGSTGSQGRNSLLFTAEGCAESGGCTPF